MGMCHLFNTVIAQLGNSHAIAKVGMASLKAFRLSFNTGHHFEKGHLPDELHAYCATIMGELCDSTR